MLNLSAQEKTPDEMIAERVVISIERLEKLLEDDCDPYGFFISVKVGVRKRGQESISLYDMDKDILLAEIYPFMSRQKFDRFDFEMSPKMHLETGKFIFSCGLVSRNEAEDIREIDLYAERYSYQFVKDGERFDLLVYTDVSIIMTKPDDGSILGDVYYYNEKGGKVLWDKQTWLSKLPEVAYIRVGPGDDKANSRKGHDRFESMGAVLNPYEITISHYFTPGHYLPIIKFRKCVQDYTDYTQFKDLEAIVKITNMVNWSDFKEHSSGKVIPKTTMRSERAKAPNFYSYFSTGNIVEGNILDSKGKPIEGTLTVVLEPDFKPAPDNYTVESMPGGKYKFEDVVSGVYKLYLATSKDKYEIVEVCNCPQKEEGPNHTYKQDLVANPLYDVYISYHSPRHAAAELVWQDLVIAFADDEEIPTVNLPGEKIIEDIIPPYKVLLPYGTETYFAEYDGAPKVIKLQWLGDGSHNVRILNRGDDINNFWICTTPENPQIHIELSVALNTTPIHVTPATDDYFALGSFKYERLEKSALENLKTGKPAVINLSNKWNEKLSIRFEPK